MMKENKVLFEKSSGECSKELIDIIDKEFGIDGRDENHNPLNGYGDWQCGMILNGPSIVNLVKLGAEWQKLKDQDAIELAEDHAMLAGMMKEREEMMKDAVECVVEDWCGNSPEITIPLNPQDFKNGDKVKIIIIKTDPQ